MLLKVFLLHELKKAGRHCLCCVFGQLHIVRVILHAIIVRFQFLRGCRGGVAGASGVLCSITLSIALACGKG